MHIFLRLLQTKYLKISERLRSWWYSRIVYKEIKAMNPASRFLKVNPETNLWNDIGMKKALTKICQALHEGSPELKKYLEADDSTSNQSQQADVESTGNEDRKMSLEDTPSKAKPLSLRQKLRQMSDVSISSCALQEGKRAKEQGQEKSDNTLETKTSHLKKSDSSPESISLLSLPEMLPLPQKKARTEHVPIPNQVQMMG
ncbi:hypothetical protein ACHAWO_006390 [Cyclotella atomus]|uniref:DUF6824 domain-containing protein n=1 Tax=Cyclotella atomus TaxID=382360 RepID=A0ABD3N2U2_9STRA